MVNPDVVPTVSIVILPLPLPFIMIGTYVPIPALPVDIPVFQCPVECVEESIMGDLYPVPFFFQRILTITVLVVLTIL